MTRRPRTAAMLTVTAMAGVALALALAPTAAADVVAPTLGQLSVTPSSPIAGQLLTVIGDGCVGVDVPVLPVDGDTPPPVGAAAAPVASTASVTVSVTGPDSFSSGDTATPSPDGTWSGDQGITLGGAGSYTVSATCVLAEVGGQQLRFDYSTLAVNVAAPPETSNPVVTCLGCDAATPGGSVTVGGTDFPRSSPVTVTLPGYPPVNVTTDDQGGFTPVSFIIRADQPAGPVTGTVAMVDGSASFPFTVTVTAAEPTADPTPTPTDTPTDTSDDDPVDTGGGVTPTRATPSLPATGVDSTVPGIIGVCLLVAGVGLVVAGRRRPALGDEA